MVDDTGLRIVRQTIIGGDSPELILTRSDGKEARFPAERDPFAGSSALSVTSFDVVDRRLEILTTAGDHVAFEMPGIDGRSPLRERTIVYLDQNHWSALAKAVHRPASLRAPEREAARAVIRMVLDEKIILPLSFAHVSETCQWEDAENRYQHALTLLRLSAGWVMRDPVQVRQHELRQILLRRFPVGSPVPLEVVTLHGGALIAGRDVEIRPFATDLPLSDQADLRTMEAVFGTADTLLDAQAEQRGKSPGWVDKNTRFSQWLVENPKPAQAKRKQTGGYFLADASGEVARVAASCGLSIERVGDWLTTTALRDLEHAPALGLYREALHDKVANAGSMWESNDLTDLFYFTCAAGYADYVACEREAAAVLRQGCQRLRRERPRIHNSLSGLVDDLAGAHA